jgi:hypothetical protein
MLANKNTFYPFILFILVLVFNWTLSYVFCKYLNQYSKFYHSESKFDRYLYKSKILEQSSITAQLELEKWLSLNNKNIPLFKSLNESQSKFMCVSILSKNRIGANVNNYVSQTIMSLLTKTPLKLEKQIQIIAFNTENDSEKNVNLLKFKNLIKIETLKSSIAHENLRIKEALDYALILKYMHSQNCQNSIIMEDDALIAHNWFQMITSSLDCIQKTFNEREFIYIKLFSGYKFFDWDWIKFPSIILKVFFYAFLITGLNWSIIQNTNIFKLTNVKLFLLIINSFSLITIFYATSVTPCGVGVRPYSTGFGTVSLLIPYSKLILLSNYLNVTIYDYLNGRTDKINAKDLIIDSFKTQNNLTEFIIEPSIIQHIGRHSSLYTRDVESSDAYKRMYKSFSWADSKTLIEFDPKYFVA